MHKTISALIATLAATAACAANSFTWPQLPEGTLPDTEVSTNVVLHVNSQKLERFTLSLETTCCTSNEVLVAIGCDSDGNGDLSFDEADLAFGFDCGARYLADYRTQTIVTNSGSSVIIDKKDFNPNWNLAKIIKRGLGEVGEEITETIENVRFTITIR
jgi:hypothetical protein